MSGFTASDAYVYKNRNKLKPPAWVVFVLDNHYNKLMLTKYALACLISLVLLAALFTLTSPEKMHATVFVGVFVMLYIICMTGLMLAGLGLRRLSFISWTPERIRRIACLVACLPVFLLVLQSIGQLTARDVLLATGLFALLYLYFNRFTARATD